MKNNQIFKERRLESKTSLLELSAYSRTPVALFYDIENERIPLSNSELKIYTDYIDQKENNFLKHLYTLNLYGDENCGSVSLYDSSFSNVSQDARMHVVTKVAATSYGKEESKSPTKLYDKLYKERNTCLEFVRISDEFNIESSLRNNINAKFHRRIDILKHKENVACFKLRIPLMVVAQLVRHRTFSFNQVSRRYTDVEDKDIFIPDEFKECVLNSTIQNHIEQSLKLYHDLCKSGTMKKEIARGVLPAYLLFADIWMIGDKDAFQNLFEIRLSMHEKVQTMTKDTVYAMYELLNEYQPNILK
jgi:thymidylate synthase ThyX